MKALQTKVRLNSLYQVVLINPKKFLKKIKSEFLGRWLLSKDPELSVVAPSPQEAERN
jgi:hypothetical protein